MTERRKPSVRNDLVKLGTLKPGERFHIPGTDLKGTFLDANECRALIQRNVEPSLVSFAARDGKLREFVAEQSGRESWSPGTEVVIDG